MSFNGLYESNDMEREISHIADSNNEYDYFIEENNQYKYHYFLSQLRENLFTWYPFKEDGNLLEIGSSYGQLTPLFTEKVKHVVAVESTNSKANIIKKRAKKAEVVVSDFNNLNIDEKFDYIVLCDIFEYVKIFNNNDNDNDNNPYIDYLKYLKNFLKEDGIIFLAISNRLGLKYFAGYKEEHTNEYFTGIDNYNNVNYVRTFSKYELEKIIEESGFTNYKFFYPYPDHVFPMCIYGDKLVNEIPYERKMQYYDVRIDLFNEGKLNQSLAKSNIAQYFANSFLVEIRNNDNEHLTDGLEFVKLNSDRRKRFRTCTIIENKDSNTIVSKSPTNKKAMNHIQKMYNESKNGLGKIKYLKCSLHGKYLVYPYIFDKTFDDYIIEAILENDKDKFYKLIEKYYDALFYGSFECNDYASDEFLKVFKISSNRTYHCQNKTNLDLIFSNLFLDGDEFVAIDYEWLFDFPVPLEYIFYRVLFHHRESNELYKNFFTIEEVFDHFNLDRSEFDLFKRWNVNFFKYVFGLHPKPKNFDIPKENIDNNLNFDKYINLILESNNPDLIKSIKRDIVINQRKIIDRKNSIIDEQRRELSILKHSNSWKMTRPLRKFRSKVRNNK